MKDKIREKVASGKWTFLQLLKMNDLAVELANEFYEELTIAEKVGLVWEMTISATDESFGAIFHAAVIKVLTDEFVIALQEMAEGATVSFTAKKVLPPPPLEEPKIEFPEPKKELQSDGTKLPKGVKRVE